MRPEENSKSTYMETYRALQGFALSPEKEIEEMTPEQTREALVQNAISLEPRQEGLKERLAAARNRLALSVVGEERLAIQEQLQKPVANSMGNWAQRATQAHLLAGRALRAEVARRLESLGPQSAMMYARNFEEGDDDDMRVILDALDELDEADEE